MCTYETEPVAQGATASGVSQNRLTTTPSYAEIVALAKKYDAVTFIDECHATGFFGPTGR